MMKEQKVNFLNVEINKKYVYNLKNSCSHCAGEHLRKDCDKSGFNESNPIVERDNLNEMRPFMKRMLEYEDFSD